MNFTRLLNSSKYQSALAVTVFTLFNLLVQVSLFADADMTDAAKRDACQKASYVILAAWAAAMGITGIEDYGAKRDAPKTDGGASGVNVYTGANAKGPTTEVVVPPSPADPTEPTRPPQPADPYPRG